MCVYYVYERWGWRCRVDSLGLRFGYATMISVQSWGFEDWLCPSALSLCLCVTPLPPYLSLSICLSVFVRRCDLLSFCVLLALSRMLSPCSLRSLTRTHYAQSLSFFLSLSLSLSLALSLPRFLSLFLSFLLSLSLLLSPVLSIPVSLSCPPSPSFQIYMKTQPLARWWIVPCAMHVGACHFIPARELGGGVKWWGVWSARDVAARGALDVFDRRRVSDSRLCCTFRFIYMYISVHINIYTYTYIYIYTYMCI